MNEKQNILKNFYKFVNKKKINRSISFNAFKMMILLLMITQPMFKYLKT